MDFGIPRRSNTKAARTGLSILLVIESIESAPDYISLLPEDPKRFAIALQADGLETAAKFEKKATTLRKQLVSKGLATHASRLWMVRP